MVKTVAKRDEGREGEGGKRGRGEGEINDKK